MNLYVVMWENWDGCNSTGGDLYYTLSEEKALEFLHNMERPADMIWHEDLDMYRYMSRYETDKHYIDVREMDTAL